MNQPDTLAAALYLTSGVRAVSQGLVGKDTLLPVQVPRLSLTNDQLDQVADAIIQLHSQAERIAALQTLAAGSWRDQMAYHWLFPDLELFHFDTLPFEIHTIEKVGVLTREDREKAMRAAGYNTFLLRSADVAIDLLTDSGTTAMSADQWAAYEGVRASAVTSDEYFDFVESIQEAFGYEYVIPTHQGRAAEHILSQTRIQPGQFVPGNMYFTTTKLHQEMAGGVFADVIVDEAHDPTSDFPWKGNIDLGKMDALVQEHGAEKIAYVSFEHSVNLAGGQPVSMDNMKEVYEYCSAIEHSGVLRCHPHGGERLYDPVEGPPLRRHAGERHRPGDDALRRRLYREREEGLSHQHRWVPGLPGQRRMGPGSRGDAPGLTRGMWWTAGWPPPTWQPSPGVCGR